RVCARRLLFDSRVDFVCDFVQPRGCAGNLRRPVRLFVGGRADFLSELVNLGNNVGDLAQRGVQILAQAKTFVDDARALIHVLDCLASLFLNALDQLGNFLGGLRRLLRQLADFIGNHGKAQAVFAGAGRFNGSVQCQQVGLFGQIVDYFDNLAVVVGALPERSDDLTGSADGGVDLVQAFGRLLHGRDAAMYLLARTVGNVEKDFRGIGNALNRGHHLVNRG